MSPLNVVSYFYTRQSCSANPSYSKQASEGSPIVTTCKAGIDHDERSFNFMLAVELEDHTDADPYAFEIELFGTFSVNAESDKPTKKDISAALLSASHILYGAARERLAVLTSNAAWGVFYLPAKVFNTKDWEIVIYDKPAAEEPKTVKKARKQKQKQSLP